MTQPRSSLAIALQDYKGIRPGIALTIAAMALIAAIAVGFAHIFMLGRSGEAIEDGQRTVRMLHSYNAALEVWRQMAAPGAELQFPEQAQLRDSIAYSLQLQLTALQDEVTDPIDKDLVGDVLADFTPGAEESTAGSELGLRGREAMIVLTARQDSALFRAAARYQQSQFIAALVIGLAVVAAGILIIPMSWMYVRYKRGIPPGM
ncbi:MAG: hypothetical protein GTN62_13200 [Gemmatimonadales bacterium]|nr:hypothetical protein [Gemmatimonadales bacterium]NIN12866.1 hypothetical protein [Gemmatimonadales bacterium]NIN51044.1 hypothetical protein [Gemmatimonadales bacterium]NIP08508.1 hypothetical protein [Gemmatimonadales bacterium]NIR02548.1 hypothetical protein [Gemmatimonadales bacterium]